MKRSHLRSSSYNRCWYITLENIMYRITLDSLLMLDNLLVRKDMDVNEHERRTLHLDTN